jgi:hypothetical protein
VLERGEGGEADDAVALCGGGAELPVSPQREERRRGIFPSLNDLLPYLFHSVCFFQP